MKAKLAAALSAMLWSLVALVYIGLVVLTMLSW